jgi:hypothetical protein
MQRGPKTGFNKLAVKMAVWAVAILFVCSPCAWANGKPSSGGSGGGGSTSTSCSGKGGQTFNVTSNILGTTSDPFQLLSDGLGTYSTFKNSRTDSGTSEILGTSCNWVLDLSNSTSRSVRLSMLYPASSGELLPSGWPVDGSLVNVPARVITACEGNSANSNGSTYSLSVGNMNYGDAPLQCGLWIKFFSNGTVYGLLLNASKYQGATWATVACQGGVSGTGSQCNSWTITPGLDINGNPGENPYDAQSSAVGELIQPSCNGCSGGTPLGLYYVDFSAVITNP